MSQKQTIGMASYQDRSGSPEDMMADRSSTEYDGWRPRLRIPTRFAIEGVKWKSVLLLRLYASRPAMFLVCEA